MTSDLDLLGKFARENSQDAFAEIVRRHLDLVYSAALRQIRSPQLAEEVAQSVFADLSRNAGKLKPNTILSVWLYTVTRRTAIDVIRKESRRQLRDQIAVEMNAMNANEGSAGVPPAWSEIEPFLDDAMAALDETDRVAVLLRYFENKNLGEVGESLKISEDAAQKRVSRAVERLREFFSKRNVTIGASGLAVLISANAVQSAPVGLAAAISTAAILTGTTVSTSVAIAATKTIAMTALQKTLVTATVAVLAGAGIYEAKQTANARAEVQALQQQQAPLAEQIRQLQRERDAATNQLAGLQAENEQLKSSPKEMELLKLRAEVTQLQARLKASNPASSASISDNDPEMQMRQRAMEIGQQANLEFEVEGRLLVLKQRLHLSPEQVEAARGVLKQINEKDDFLQAKAPDPDLMALLTPDQQVLLEQLIKERLQNTIRKWSEGQAGTEIFTLEAYLGLNQQQQDKAFPVLVDCYQKIVQQHLEQPGAPVMNVTVEEMKKLTDQKINLFQNILTGDQFAIYNKYEEQTLKAYELGQPSR